MNSKNTVIGALVLTLFASFGVHYLTKNEPQTVAPVAVEQIEQVSKDQTQDVADLAKANGYAPSKRIIESILRASETYHIDALELTAIAIVETGLGKNARTRVNSNGTKDHGLFQINTVNVPKCVEYNLDSPEGSALCAAKLLSGIKAKRADYLGVYHSKTPSRKVAYMQKVSQVLNQGDNK